MGQNNKNEITIALAGNPNSGKTTIFNALTGARQHVGNYPGVTVEKKEGKCNYKDYKIKVVDLPGTYSLTAYSLDEVVARKFLIEERPDVVVDIIDSSNLQRNLYLATQLAELGIPFILCLNMSDIAKKKGLRLDENLFSRLIGCEIVFTVGHKKEGIEALFEKIITVATGESKIKPVQVNFGKEIENELEKLLEIIKKDKSLTQKVSARYISIKLLENDKEELEHIKGSSIEQEAIYQIEESTKHLEMIFGEDVEGRIVDMRYGFIKGVVKESARQLERHKLDVSDKIDKILTNRILGLPIFAFFMWLIFKMTFTLAEKPMEWIESFFGWFGELIGNVIPEGIINSLIVDGIIGGVGGVLVFLPNILILFIAIAILEDSGYMSRAAFIMDRIMHKFGLHGKSFIPMLIGFGCTIPAYMGCRILESKRDRLVTMHVNTFMSCGARLPVYVLFAGAFFPKEAAGNIIFIIYILGIVIAVAMAKIFSKVRFRGESAPFVMELPPYHLPTIKGILIHMWEKGKLYLKKAGTIILAVSIIMWVLMSFPKVTSYSKDYYKLINGIETSNQIEEIKENKIEDFENERATEDLSYSFAGRIGKAIEPVIKPLGFDWRLGIGLFAGFAAKEVIVSTLGTVYSVGEADEESETLRDKLRNDIAYSPLIAFSLMIFVLLYFPCIAAMVVFYKETKSLKEVLFQMIYTTALAYIMALIVYQGGSLLGLG